VITDDERLLIERRLGRIRGERSYRVDAKGTVIHRP